MIRSGGLAVYIDNIRQIGGHSAENAGSTQHGQVASGCIVDWGESEALRGSDGGSAIRDAVAQVDYAVVVSYRSNAVSAIQVVDHAGIGGGQAGHAQSVAIDVGVAFEQVSSSDGVGGIFFASRKCGSCTSQ